MRGFIQLFSNKSPLKEVEQLYIHLTMAEIQRTEKIINDYLSLTKPEFYHPFEINVSTQLVKVQSLLTSYAVMNK